MQSEMGQPEKAVRLYREGIALKKTIAEQFPDNWRWRDFPYMYNRFTLVLERLGRYEEAIKEIKIYETLPCQNKGIKSDRQAMEKRKERLEKKFEFKQKEN